MWIFRPSKLHPKKVSENNVDFSAREITPKKIHGKQQVFQTSKLRQKKLCGTDMDFSISEITSKKFVEMTWKLVEIWSSTYRLALSTISSI